MLGCADSYSCGAFNKASLTVQGRRCSLAEFNDVGWVGLAVVVRDENGGSPDVIYCTVEELGRAPHSDVRYDLGA